MFPVHFQVEREFIVFGSQEANPDLFPEAPDFFRQLLH